MRLCADGCGSEKFLFLLVNNVVCRQDCVAEWSGAASAVLECTNIVGCVSPTTLGGCSTQHGCTCCTVVALLQQNVCTACNANLCATNNVGLGRETPNSPSIGTHSLQTRPHLPPIGLNLSHSASVCFIRVSVWSGMDQYARKYRVSRAVVCPLQKWSLVEACTNQICVAMWCSVLLPP